MNDSTLTSDPFIGQIIFFAGNFAPRGWANCDGQLLPISSYSALFSLLGTMYGGDGRTTFALPDLRGAFPLHPGTGPGRPSYQQGQRGGQTDTQLSAVHLPAHTHALRASNIDGNTPDPSGNYLANSVGFDRDFTNDASGLTNMNAGSVTSTGNGQLFSNMPPFVGIRAIIALQGIYPSRS